MQASAKYLAAYGATLDGLESFRISTENQLRSLEQGFSTLFRQPIELLLEGFVTPQGQQVWGLQQLEQRFVRDFEKTLKEHPLADFIERTPGLGLKTVGRLLVCIGDPYWHPPYLTDHFKDGQPAPKVIPPEGRPRLLTELYSYCGMGVDENGMAPRHRRGVQGRWNDMARKRLYVIAAGCVKNIHSAYRALYDETRAKYAKQTHHYQCQNSKRPPNGSNGCGTREHPEWGAPGSPYRDGHLHALGLRAVMKAVLKDLWLESKRLHEQEA